MNRRTLLIGAFLFMLTRKSRCTFAHYHFSLISLIEWNVWRNEKLNTTCILNQKKNWDQSFSNKLFQMLTCAIYNKIYALLFLLDIMNVEVVSYPLEILAQRLLTNQKLILNRFSLQKVSLGIFLQFGYVTVICMRS